MPLPVFSPTTKYNYTSRLMVLCSIVSGLPLNLTRLDGTAAPAEGEMSNENKDCIFYPVRK